MNKKLKQTIIALVITILMVVMDQYTKYLVVAKMHLHESIPLVKGVFELNYIHNNGSAWGMLGGKTLLLLIISSIVMIALCYVFYNVAGPAKYALIRFSIAILLGGAIGNMIDRVRLKYVVDFLYFKLIDFPVFNYADICVTVSLFVIIISIIFKYKPDDYDVFLGDKKFNEEDESYISLRKEK